MEIETYGRLLSEKITGILFYLLHPQWLCASKNKI